MAAGRRARTLVIGVLLALCLVLAGPAGAASREVELRGVEFAPPELTINLDDTVVWKHKGGAPHSVTADDGSFDSHPNCTLGGLVGCMNEGNDPYAFTFTKESKPLEGKDLSKDVLIPYHCKIHGEKGGNGMAGVIKVRASASPPPPPAPVTTQPEAPSSTTVTTKPKPASVTTTTRPLTTSSTVVRSTTTLAETTTTLTPNEPPVFDPGSDDGGEGASGSNTGASGAAGGVTDGNKGGDDTGAVAVIVALLLAVSAGGGYLLWRLRPHRGT